MSTTSTYPIDAVCRLTGLRSSTLRRWELLGLLQPAATDQRGRRHYDSENLAAVLHLALLRALGLPPPDRTTWHAGAPPEGLLRRAAEMVAEQTRIAQELYLELRRAEPKVDIQGRLRLIELIVRWQQP